MSLCQCLLKCLLKRNIHEEYTWNIYHQTKRIFNKFSLKIFTQSNFQVLQSGRRHRSNIYLYPPSWRDFNKYSSANTLYDPLHPRSISAIFIIAINIGSSMIMHYRNLAILGTESALLRHSLHHVLSGRQENGKQRILLTIAWRLSSGTINMNAEPIKKQKCICLVEFDTISSCHRQAESQNSALNNL